MNSRVLLVGAVEKICAVEIQKDLVLQRWLSAFCHFNHTLDTVVHIIVVAEGTKRAELVNVKNNCYVSICYVSYSYLS